MVGKYGVPYFVWKDSKKIRNPEYDRLQRRANRVQRREYMKRWRHDHPEQFHAQMKLYRSRHPLLVKAGMYRWYHKLREQVLSHYSPRLSCSRCGYNSNILALELHHVNGRGGKHRRELRSCTTVYTRLRKEGFPPGFEVLCANCHSIQTWAGISKSATGNYLRKLSMG